MRRKRSKRFLTITRRGRAKKVRKVRIGAKTFKPDKKMVALVRRIERAELKAHKPKRAHGRIRRASMARRKRKGYTRYVRVRSRSRRRSSRGFGMSGMTGKLGRIGLGVAAGTGATIAVNQIGAMTGFAQISAFAPIAGLAAAWGTTGGGMIERAIAVLPFVAGLGISLGSFMPGASASSSTNW